MPTAAEALRDAMAQAHRVQRRDRFAEADLDGAGLRVRAERVRSGEKTLRDTAAGADWHRRYSAQAEGWAELGQGVRATAGVQLERTTDGFAGGPLFTTRSRTLSKEAGVGLALAGHGHIGLSVFDRGGWTPGDTAQEANRIANGEDPARKGIAFGVSDIPLPPIGDTVNARAGFELQRAGTPFAQTAATTARLSLRLQF